MTLRQDALRHLEVTVLRFWFAVLVLGFGAGAAALSGPAKWMANDDAAMAQIASGGFTGTPSGQLGYVSQVLGWPLSLAYRIDGVPWYSLAVTSTFVLALSFVASLVRRQVFPLWLVLALPTVVWLALRPTFTVAGIVAAGAGTLGIVATLRTGRVPWAGFLLVLTGVLWRVDSGLLALLLVLPMIVASRVIDDRKWTLRPTLYWALALAPVAWLVTKVDSSCFGSDSCQNWAPYQEYRRLAATFHTAPRGDFLQAAGDVSGTWSSAASRVWLNFSYPDADLFSLPYLSTVNSVAPNVFRTLAPDYSGHVREVLVQYFGTTWLVLAALLIFGLAPILRASKPLRVTALVGVVAFWPVVILSVVALVRLRPTLLVGASVVTMMSMAVLASWTGESLTSRVRRIASAGCAAIGVLIAISSSLVGQHSFSALSEESRDFTVRRDNFLVKLEVARGSDRIFAQGNVVDYLGPKPYQDVASTIDVRSPLSGGWLVFSPAFTERRQALGFGDVYEDLGLALRPGQQQAKFLGSYTTALDTAALMTEIDSEGRVWEPVQGEVLTDPGDVSVGEIYLWGFSSVGPVGDS